MRALRQLLMLSTTGLVLSACGLMPSKLPEPVGHTTGMTPVIPPPQRGWALMYPELAADTGSGGELTNMADPAATSATDGGLYDFSSMLHGGGGPGRIAWLQSVQDAVSKARGEGKPLLILITHQMSQPARVMENTLLLAPELRSLVEEHFIPVRLDYANPDTKDSSYYQDFKKRLKVRGHPALLVTLPDGTEILRLTGYKPEQAEHYLSELQESVKKVEKATTARRAKMEHDGYRLWAGKAGVPVFARLTKLDANKASFMGEWGVPFDTFTSRLSEEDQAWIAGRQQAAASRQPVEDP